MKTVIAFIATVLLSYPSAGLAGGGGGNPGTDAATTVKGSKSNTSERVGAPGEGAGGAGTEERATSVKSSKSNSSERAIQPPGKGTDAAEEHR